MLDIAQSCTSQDLRMCTNCKKNDYFSVKLDQSNGESCSIENCRKRISAKLLGFQSNTPMYKRKTLAMF